MKETEFQRRVIAEAEVAGWDVDLIYHAYDSRRSREGFPDLVMLRPPRLLVVELKMPGRRATGAQAKWLAAWGAIPSAEVYLWYPADEALILGVLAGAAVEEGCLSWQQAARS